MFSIFNFKKANGSDQMNKEAMDMKSSDAGNMESKELNIGEDMYAEAIRRATGDGVNVDRELASVLLVSAAKRGCVDAMFDLGMAYLIDSKSNMGDPDALEWFARAAEAGHEFAKQIMDSVEVYVPDKEYTKAEIRELKNRVKRTADAKTMVELARCYADGNGVKRDARKAFELFSAAANLGSIAAYNNLAFMYSEGVGTESDYDKAEQCFIKCLEDDEEGVGAVNLAEMYFDNRYGKLNRAEAIRLYTEAAEKGMPYAQYMLGICYQSGYGVEVDYGTSAEWFRKAAEQGDEGAMNELAICYQGGLGVEQSDELAEEWFKKSYGVEDISELADMEPPLGGEEIVEEIYNQFEKWNGPLEVAR